MSSSTSATKKKSKKKVDDEEDESEEEETYSSDDDGTNSDEEDEDEEDDKSNCGDLNEKDKEVIVNMVRNQEIIPDEMIEKVMQHFKVRKDAVSLDIDVYQSEGREGWMCPPCFWTGETMNPVQLPKLLFGKRQFYGSKNEEVYLTGEEAGKPPDNKKSATKKRNTRSDWKGRRNMFDLLLTNLIETFQENCGLELVVSWNKKPKDGGDQIDFCPKRWCYLICTFCKKKPRPVVRIQFASNEKEGKYCFYLKLHEIYTFIPVREKERRVNQVNYVCSFAKVSEKINACLDFPWMQTES